MVPKDSPSSDVLLRWAGRIRGRAKAKGPDGAGKRVGLETETRTNGILCIGSAGACVPWSLQSQVLVIPVLSPPPWGWDNVCLSLEVVVAEQDV